MADFLSDEWLAEAQTGLAGLGPADGPTMAISYVVSGAPMGKVTVAVEIVDGSVVAVRKEKLSDPDCTLTLKVADGLAILRGDTKAEVAFMTGQLKVEGAYEQWLVGLQAWRRDPQVVAALAELAG